MTPMAAVIELLERVGAEQDAVVLITKHELFRWPPEAVSAMKSQKLIVKAQPATSAICPGCERDCVMPVHTLPNKSGDTGSFIVCDKRSDINCVLVSSEHLTQWRCSAKSVRGFVAGCLELQCSEKRSNNAGLWEIGIASGEKRSQMLCLQANGGLSLVAGSNTVPLAECIGYQGDAYSLNGTMIRQLVDLSTTTDALYTPSNARREARKLETQAMYGTWKKAYRKLNRKRPNMSDVWYSQRIARMGISNGRNAETIRKRMKN